MSLKKLPKINAKAPSGYQWDTPIEALSKWDASLVSAEIGDTTITIYDHIGDDGWGEGVTAKRVAGALRSIGSRDITVSINSPGGDFFEGVAIYNLLREHPHKVTVKVVGVAASAASVIAMAGDEIQVAKTGWLMIHNAWAFVVGNKNDLREAADVLDGFDEAMVGLYADATGIDKKEVARLMDDETWMSGEEAVSMAFASSLLSSDEVQADEEEKSANATVRKVDNILAKQGLPRSERKALINQIKGMPGAARNVMPGADILEEISTLTATIRG